MKHFLAMLAVASWCGLVFGAEEAKPFSLKTSPKLPTLKAGGFAEEPSFADEFEAGWPKQAEYWKVATWKQNKTQMFFNSWTQEKWIKGPPKDKAEYLIDWVRFYPYVKQ